MVLKYVYSEDLCLHPSSKGYELKRGKYDIKLSEITIERKTHEIEFVNYLSDNISLLADSSFIVFIAGRELYLFDELSGNYIPFVSLTLPGEQSEGFWRRVLGINEGEMTEVFVNKGTGRNFICNKEFLLTMCTYYRLKDEGAEVYRKCRITSPNGKVRDIIAPHEKMKSQLRSLNKVFQNLFDGKNINFQVAYKKNKNVLSNAEIHKNNPYVFKVDLKDFFPSCKRDLIESKLKFLFENTYNGTVLMKEFLDIILYDDALFIGSPISGTLANYSLAQFASLLKGITTNDEVEFSVYADDMTFSSKKWISEKYINGIIKYALEELGLEDYFHLNEKKSVGQSKIRRHITGVSFNAENEPTSSRAISRYIRTALYHSELGGSMDKPKVKGKIQYALSIEGLDGKVSRILKKYKDLVQKEGLLSEKQGGVIFAE